MRILRLHGSFEDVGRQVGVATGDDVAALYERLVAYLLEHSTVGSARRMIDIASRYALSAQDQFPPAIAYLKGLAEGVGAPFHEIAVIAFSEEIAAQHLPASEKCSTLVARTPRGWLIGHNEDYEPHYYGRMLAMDVTFDGCPRVACLTYPGQLPAVGPSLNAHGVAITNNSLWPEAQSGLSQVVRQFQASLAPDLDAAVGILAGRPNALTTHYVVADGTLDDAVSVEISNAATAEAEVMLEQISGSFCHANHVLRLPLRAPDPALALASNSFRRQAILEGIAKTALPQSPDEMMERLSRNDGILHRTPAQNPVSVTLATVVIRPSTGEFWVRDADPSAPVRDFHVQMKESRLN